MKKTKRFKRKLAQLVLFFLGRGLQSAYKLDEAVKEEFNALPDMFSIRLNIAPIGPALVFYKKKDRLIVYRGTKALDMHPEIDIIFKNIDGALQVLLARVGIAEAYCQHRMLVCGDVYKTVGIIRVMDKVENYLFPSFIAKRILVRRPEKEVSSLRFYLSVLMNI